MIASVVRAGFVTGILFVSLLSGCHSDNSGSSDKPSTGNAKNHSDGNTSSGDGNSSEQSGESGNAGASRNAGLPVGTVTITPESQKKVGIRVAPVVVRPLPQQLFVNGQVSMDERHTSHIGARADGVVERVLVLPGDAVRAGQTLAWLHSHSVHETVGALAQAFDAVDRQTSAVKFAEMNRDRYQKLLALQSASQEEAQRAQQEFKQAQQNLRDAEASVHMEREHLSELLQVPPATLTPATLYNRELIPIRAEGSGVVVQRDITVGQVLTAGQQAFVVSNLNTIWVTGAVNEKDIPQVHRGQSARVSLQGVPGNSVQGYVDTLGSQLDPQTRTAPIRIIVANPATRLRPGMYVSAEIALGATEDDVFVPEGSVQEVNGLQAVFVATDPTHFTVRAVTLREHVDGMIHVLQGLSPQDHVVVDGAFMVKGELLKGSVGEG